MTFALNANDFTKFIANGLIYIGAALVSSDVSSGQHFNLSTGTPSYADIFLAVGLLTHIGSGIASWWASNHTCLNTTDIDAVPLQYE